ncbi:hypothetical protein RHGRI_011235 [Rhododendron griersonianum]|uniref:Sm domain-containing protein n=1 Tax=Rhododendron griersonianum TaxID=479676 RepID=A0AAV6KL20_9ERIC|nr:hypothetical protein RHGRI_011235 [Rhododendron griersonianum]
MIFTVTVTGTLKGYDQLLNLVLDEAIEFLRGLSLEAAAGRDTKPTLTYSVPSPSLSKARSETDGIAETGASSSLDRTDLVTTACLPPKLSILLQETSEIEVLLSLFELGEVLSFVSSN